MRHHRVLLMGCFPLNRAMLSALTRLPALCSFVVCMSAAVPASAFCYEQAGQRYGVNPWLLKAIAQVESRENPLAVNINPNFRQRNEDIGLMQINTVWMSQLARYGITRDALLRDACLNVMVGAWILAQQQAKFGNTWYAVGAYHSQTPALNQRYAHRVFTALQKMKVN